MRGVVVAVVLAGCGRLDFGDTVDSGARLGDAAPDEGGPLTYRDAVLADSPLGYWRLADVGAVAHDETGQMDGSFVGTCEHQVAGALADDANTATEFDGSTCSLSLGGGFAFPGATAFSLELWISTPPTARFQYVAMKETRSNDQPIDGYAFVVGSVGAYCERVASSNIVGTAQTALAAGYHHVAFVYDGASLQLYLDGEVAASEPDATALNVYDAPLYIGGLPSDTGFVTGSIDEVAVYGHALTADRVALHHLIGVAGPQ